MMTSIQVVKMSVTSTDNSCSQDLTLTWTIKLHYDKLIILVIQ